MTVLAATVPLLRTGPFLLLGLVLGFFVFRRTMLFRQRAGVSPWHIHPAVWALITVFFALIGTFGALIAMATTRPRVGSGGPYGGGPYGGGPFGGRRFGGRVGGPFGGGPYGGGPYGGGPFGGGPYRGGPYGSPSSADPSSSSPYGGGVAGPGAGGSSVPGHRKVIDVASTPVPPAGPPGWHADPSGRHQFRYWDGSDWTEHVLDSGVAAEDPLPA